MYKKMTNEDIKVLKTFVEKENFLVGEEISKDFCKDELGTVSGTPEIMM